LLGFSVGLGLKFGFRFSVSNIARIAPRELHMPPGSPGRMAVKPACVRFFSILLFIAVTLVLLDFRT